MKRFAHSIALTIFVLLSTAYSCHSQEGPSRPTVTLTFTQSTTTGITANCWYRSTTSTPTLPGTCSTAPVTTFTDSTPAAGTTYTYWVTAQVGATESAYSTPLSVPVPANPGAPTNLNAPTVTKNEGPQPSNVTASVLWVPRP